MDLSSPTVAGSPDKQTILVVDDDPAILQGVADLLVLNGYQVLLAPNGLAALSVLSQERPELIVSDITMPEMDGYRFFEAIRSNPAWASIPFIFLTARGQLTDIRSGQRMGADAYVTKPFEPLDLLIAIENRLKRTREIQALGEAEINAMKQQLIMIFSHELRTPLTYIYGYVSLLEDHTHMDAAAIDDMLGAIRRGAERLHRLIEDLMLIIRIDSGVIALEFDQYVSYEDLTPRLRALVAQRRAAVANRIEIVDQLPDRLPLACVGTYIENALDRLLSNAIKFSRQEGGHVLVDGQIVDENLVLRVIDDGIGIAPAQQKLIFEPLRQLDRDVMEQQGAGLGLTIARSLVRLHGGDIVVQSAPGLGSTFSICLPLAEAASQPTGFDMQTALR